MCGCGAVWFVLHGDRRTRPTGQARAPTQRVHRHACLCTVQSNACTDMLLYDVHIIKCTTMSTILVTG